MAVVASLDVLLRATTKNFDDGMRRSQSRLAAFGKASIGIGLAVGAGATALAVMRKEFEAVDRVAKQAARIGETTDEITRLQFAAELTGAGAESLAAGLDVMQKRLGEAAMGSGEAAKHLENLGLSVDELLTKSPAEQFKIIAEAISGMDSQAEKAAATAGIFSRANQDLVNTLDLGAKGLAEAARQSDKFGNTIKNESAKGAEDALDAMTRLSAAIGGLKRSLALAFGEDLTDFVNDIAELTTSISELSTAFGGLGDKIPVTSLGIAAKFLGVMNDQLRQMRAGGPFTEAQKRADTSIFEDLFNAVPFKKDVPAGTFTIGGGGLFGGTRDRNDIPKAEKPKETTQQKQLSELQKIGRELRDNRLRPALL